MMISAIQNFAAQFEYEPDIKNSDKLGNYSGYIVIGMGGSHLAADLIKMWHPETPLIIHHNYGLPQVPEEILKNSLIIADSYSGNTEEIIEALEKAEKKGYAVAVISIGGELIKEAEKKNLPYIRLPDTHIQPRSALGFSVKALLKLMGDKKTLKEVSKLSEVLKPDAYEKEGKALAEKLKDAVPVIYSSEKNKATAYNWKIKLNETGKIPAFYNVFPELNHNEMTGFDAKPATIELSEKFHFIILKDRKDNPRVQKRMDILRKLYTDRNLPVEVVELEGENIYHKTFASLVLADYAAYYTAELYGVESEQVPMVEEFKKLISE